MKFSKEKPSLPGFQITPMLDVVFLLLCFFVTASVYSQWENEVNIQLPTASSGETPNRLPGEIIVNVSADGTLRVNQRELSLEAFGAKCALVAKHFRGHPIVLRADKATPYEAVMKVLDTCAKHDIWNISFATEGPAPEAAPAAAK